MVTVFSQEASTALFSRLEGAVADGRGRSIRYRQAQLHVLHDSLRKASKQIIEAIKEDSNNLNGDAEIEYYLAMTSITKLYAELDLKAAVEEEYKIWYSKDNIKRRLPYGMVLIRPQSHTRFFSIISAVAAAVAAGNCVVLELEQTLLKVDKVIKSEVKVIDQESVLIATSQVKDETFLNECLVVDQKSEQRVPSFNSMHGKRSPVLAVIDRNANIEEAARSICLSKERFGGISPNAPDIVLVNEWRKEEFIAACIRLLSDATARRVVKMSQQSQPQILPQNMNEQQDIGIKIFETSAIQLIELYSCDSAIVSRSATGRRLLLYPTTGLVDSTSLAAKLGPFSATYLFSNPAGGKFLSQQIESNVTFVNQIPVHVLVGPPFPFTMGASDLELRYDIDMMSKIRPEKIQSPSESFSLPSTMIEQNASDAARRLLVETALNPLKLIEQGSGKDLGIFGRGVVIGLLVYGLPTLAMCGLGVYTAVGRILDYLVI